LTVNLGFDELLRLVKQLPANKIAKLKAELDNKSGDQKPLQPVGYYSTG